MWQIEAYRRLVEARAGGACEYCRLLQAGTGVTFHIEHLVPRSRGGQTVMSNLALSCPACKHGQVGSNNWERIKAERRSLSLTHPPTRSPVFPIFPIRRPSGARTSRPEEIRFT